MPEFAARIRSILQKRVLTEEESQLVRGASTEVVYHALAAITRGVLTPGWEDTKTEFNGSKRANYLSVEWLMGPQMDTALHASRLAESVKHKLGEEKFLEVQNFARDLGLGNGGLGRLAACFIDASAQQGQPMAGYGLHFKKGFFQQGTGEYGEQTVIDDSWYEANRSWAKPEANPLDAQGKPIAVKFGGRVELEHLPASAQYPYGFVKHKWVDAIDVRATRHDLPVPSEDGKTALTLGLWDVAPEFNAEGHLANIAKKVNDRLYPDDSTQDGKTLRLAQEFFLASASVQDIIARHEMLYGVGHLENLSETAAIQLNDTHPALAIPELIRILHDERGIEWKKTQEIVSQVCFYTNHTLAPEALEKWDKGLLNYVLPRHLEIIEGLNGDLMREFNAKAATDPTLQQYRDTIPLIDHQGVHMARMAAAFGGGTNGVSRLHSELVKTDLFPGLVKMGRSFRNVTNGISQTRWLKRANPALSDLITRTMPDQDWSLNLDTVTHALKNVQDDPDFLAELIVIKKHNKDNLVRRIKQENGIDINPHALVDAQVKRIHGYKRQFLNILHTVALYQDILAHPEKERPPVLKLFAGKAAPSYVYANDCITLIHWLGEKINNDNKVGDKLKAVFVGDYSVSKAQDIFAAADLSEQTSIAGMEASGTGNMKFSLNGALTIGTRDGANIEIGEQAGEENFFFFGMNEKEVSALKGIGEGEYKNRFVDGKKNARLRSALEYLRDNLSKDSNPAISRLAYMANDILRGQDEWRVAADFNDYWKKQDAAHALYLKPLEWARQSCINIGAGAAFSAGKAIGQYAEFWDIKPRTFPADAHNNLMGQSLEKKLRHG